ncbi:MAG: N-acetylmuramoyl-L-alanine amidase [Candidatus Marinimicrobia bacterium]|nr:N-acetylmuramoyl-L-alanine amidase [Candidatus Neomarinimicrobiota bacterium]
MKRFIIFLFIISSFLGAQEIDTITYKICVNAGHGGHDSNDRPPVTPAGFWESEGNLTKALVLETLFNEYGVADVDDPTRAQFDVIMTRRHNRSQDDLYLSSIAAMANSNNADWMHSIHSNAGGGTAHYTLMLYPGPTGDPRINGISGYPKCPEEETLSTIMASNIHRALQTSGTMLAGDWSFYGTGGPYLGVFRTLQVPGVLSEGTFHDYYPETFRLQNLDFRINESWAIALSFYDLLDLPEPEFANVAGIVRTKDEIVNYTYRSGTNDKYMPVDSIVVTMNPGERKYYGNTTMYVDEYTPQWSKAGSGDYYTNGANNNDGNNRQNGFFLFDSVDYGTYELVFEAPGFWADTTQITVDDSKFFWNRNFFMQSSRPPYVRAFSPKQNEEMHPAWEPLEFVFSNTMDSANVRSGLEIVPHADLLFHWNDDYTELSLSAAGDTLVVETNYTLTLKADSILANRNQKLDGNGDGTAGDDFVLHFTTSPPDIYPPAIDVWFPSKFARHDDLQPVISYIYDEYIDTTESIEDKYVLYQSSIDDLVPTIFDMYFIDGRTIVSLFPTEELVRSTRYTRLVYSGISDLAGNITSSGQSTGLIINTSIPYYADTLVIDGFSPSTLTNAWKQPSYSGSTVNLLDGSATADSRIVNHSNGSSHSMKLYYKFAPDTTGFLREYVDVGSTPAGRKFTDESVMQAWVFGDGSGNLFRFAVDDPSGTGSHEVSPWFPIDFLGWRLLKWDLRDGVTGDWADISDGTLDGELNFDSFQIRYVDSLGNNEGTIYIEDLMVMTPGGVAVRETDIARDFVLEQNYPNPFNPVTAIPYRLSADTEIDLSIFDVSGKRIATLVNKYQQAGTYSVNFDAGHLPSGIYIARLRTSNGIKNRKMLLVK